jgi:hypothetical protein
MPDKPGKLRGRIMTQWRKIPSVTSGGKQYFYNADTVIGKLSIVWNRFAQSYFLQSESYWTGHEYKHEIEIQVASVQAGKKQAELLIQREAMYKATKDSIRQDEQNTKNMLRVFAVK